MQEDAQIVTQVLQLCDGGGPVQNFGCASAVLHIVHQALHVFLVAPGIARSAVGGVSWRHCRQRHVDVLPRFDLDGRY